MKNMTRDHRPKLWENFRPKTKALEHCNLPILCFFSYFHYWTILNKCVVCGCVYHWLVEEAPCYFCFLFVHSNERERNEGEKENRVDVYIIISLEHSSPFPFMPTHGHRYISDKNGTEAIFPSRFSSSSSRLLWSFPIPISYSGCGWAQSVTFILIYAQSFSHWKMKAERVSLTPGESQEKCTYDLHYTSGCIHELLHYDVMDFNSKQEWIASVLIHERWGFISRKGGEMEEG